MVNKSEGVVAKIKKEKKPLKVIPVVLSGEECLVKLRSLSDLYFSSQRVLFAAQNRIRAVEQGKDKTPGVPDYTQDPFCHNMYQALNYLSFQMEKYIPALPCYHWLMGVPGINRTLACKLGGLIPMTSEDDFRHFSQLRKFSGYAPGFDKKVKGEKLPYNANLKVVMYQVGDCIIRTYNRMQASPKDWHPAEHYGKFYYQWRLTYARRHGVGDAGREWLEKRGIKETIEDYKVHRPSISKPGTTTPEWPDVRQHFGSLRKMYDVLGYHLWKVWRVSMGWDTSVPWPNDERHIPGHHTYFHEDEFSSPMMAAKKIKQHRGNKKLSDFIKDAPLPEEPTEEEAAVNRDE